MLSKEELLKSRYKVIADYPKSAFIVGNIYKEWIMEDYKPDKYPYLFKKLEWWEDRTIEQLKSVEFVKVIKYVGYWLEGDIVKTKGFIVEEGKPYGYKLTNHFHPVYCLLPATKEEYENQHSKSYPHIE